VIPQKFKETVSSYGARIEIYNVYVKRGYQKNLAMKQNDREECEKIKCERKSK
jgi:hypothetical protein